MPNKLMRQADKYSRKHRRRKAWQRIVASLACVVVFVTTYMLILPAITMEQTTYCGLEEHLHGDECWETQLVCELDTETPHIHSDECYEDKDVLVCDQEEYSGHVHDESCIEVEEILVCEEEHDHTDECFESNETYMCGQEEGEGAHTHSSECYDAEQFLICDIPEGIHEHTEDCYEEVLNCGLKEHTHSLACYSDPDADVEGRDDWEYSVSSVELTQIWSDDIVAIAESQLGYAESTRNYTVTEEDEIKGYSRYGAWYGDPYGDWDAMFVSFCLNYAEIPESAIPYASDCERWIQQMSKAKYDCFYDAESYNPAKGDLIFFDLDGSDSADHVGIVMEVSDNEETGAWQVRTIEGDVDDCVRSARYEADDPLIMGYGKLPEYNEEFQSNHSQGGSSSAEGEKSGTFELTASTVNGISIRLTGLEEFLPYPADEISVTVEAIINENAAALIDAAVADTELENGQLYLFDVRLWRGDEEVEPTGPVVLTFEGVTSPEAGEIAGVFHVDEENEKATDMNAELTDDGSVVVNTDHFSLYAVMVASEAGGTFGIEYSITATWNTAVNSVTSLEFTASNSSTDNVTYRIEYSDDDGITWQTAVSASNKVNKNISVTMDASSALADDSLSRIYRVYGTRDKNNYGYTASITLKDILDSVRPGFSDWLENSYMQDFGGTAQPTTQEELYAAFAVYYGLPTVTIATRMDGNTMYVDATHDEGNYTYIWEYRNANGSWVSLCSDATASINASEISVLLNGGKEVRCSLYQGSQIKATSNTLFVDPLREVYDAAIEAINTGLNLGDLAIYGTQFTDYFYYGNVAKDDRVPFYDAQSYADYLAQTYLNKGLSAVQEEWEKYLYDLYDPSYDLKVKDNINGGYPGNGFTYGDINLGWAKDKGTSFHGTLSPQIDDLNYAFLEDGVDYSNFVSNLEKKATAVAPGDENSERKYDIEIIADAQAKARGPVAMILQIQTSWQMFDLAHANALSGDGYTKVGALADNTELATLYDIKQALLRFVDYMENNYPGNNVVLGITEVQHADSQTMFSGTDASGKPLYVTNNYDILRQSIRAWDTFGNCEHVHYDTVALKNACENLESNLGEWKDFYGKRMQYNDIQKVAVIIGGPTENSNNEKGYGCILPWPTFQEEGLNSVYSIRTNEGTPLSTNAANIISWLDYSENNIAPAFKDGVGKSFTEKYVATTEDAVFNYLVRIAEMEMGKNGIEITAEDKYVEDLTVTDTISDELFLLDESEPIVATIYNKDGTVESQQIIPLDDPDLTIQKNPNGTTTVTYNFGRIYNTKKCALHFGIRANEDYIGSNNVYSNVGTPVATYSHEKIDSDGTGTGEIDHYNVESFDTPEVNVPIQFDTTDGDTTTIIMGDKVDLADLSTEIVEHAETLIDNYDQINGTLSYTWILPDGTEVDMGGVTVKNGSIGVQSPPSREYEFTGTEAGQYVCMLKVTFTPESVDTSSKNFSDDKTAVAVGTLTKVGNVWINVVAGDSTQRFFVRKDWVGGPPAGTEAITFRVLANGESVLDESGNQLEYTLSAQNNWETEVSSLPAVKDGVVQNYTIEENSVPQGYLASYSTENHQENDWAAKMTLTFIPSSNQDNKTLKITYRYNGQEYTYTTPKDSYKKNMSYSFIVDNLPLDENGEPYSGEIVSVIKVEDNKTVKLSSSNTVSERYLRGITIVEIKVITNTPAYELPSTGGFGTGPNILGGLHLMLSAATLLLYKQFKRRKEDY